MVENKKPRLVGNFIRQKREALGLSQRALGQKFTPPVTTQFISNVERGVTPLSPRAESLRTLTAMGVQATVDDFGAGGASFTALNRLPADSLKIDRGLVANIRNIFIPNTTGHSRYLTMKTWKIKPCVERRLQGLSKMPPGL